MDPATALAGLASALGVVNELMSGKATNDALRERLGVVAERMALAQDQMRHQGELLAREEARSAELLAELTEARRENGELKAKVGVLSEQTKPSPFVERKGLLFRRTAEGAWSDSAYCPNCNRALTEAHNHLACTKACGFAKLMGSSIKRAVLAELRSADAAPKTCQADYDPIGGV